MSQTPAKALHLLHTQRTGPEVTPQSLNSRSFVFLILCNSHMYIFRKHSKNANNSFLFASHFSFSSMKSDANIRFITAFFRFMTYSMHLLTIFFATWSSAQILSSSLSLPPRLLASFSISAILYSRIRSATASSTHSKTSFTINLCGSQVGPWLAPNSHARINCFNSRSVPLLSQSVPLLPLAVFLFNSINFPGHLSCTFVKQTLVEFLGQFLSQPFQSHSYSQFHCTSLVETSSSFHTVTA